MATRPKARQTPSKATKEAFAAGKGVPPPLRRMSTPLMEGVKVVKEPLPPPGLRLISADTARATAMTDNSSVVSLCDSLIDASTKCIYEMSLTRTASQFGGGANHARLQASIAAIDQALQAGVDMRNALMTHYHND